MAKVLIIQDSDFSKNAVSFMPVKPGETRYYRDARNFEIYAVNVASIGNYILSSDKLNLKGRIINTIRFVPGNADQKVKIYDIDFSTGTPIIKEIGSYTTTNEDVQNGYAIASIGDHVVIGNIGIGDSNALTTGYKYGVKEGDEAFHVYNNGIYQYDQTVFTRVTGISVMYIEK